MTDPNAWLMGGGGKSARFDNVGDSITGTITTPPEVKQQTNFDTGKPEFWDNGDPKMQLVVTLATDLRDPTDAEDDGTRRLYVKAKLQQAVRDAVRASSAIGLEVGGRLTVTYSGDGEAPRKGANPPKLYTATYIPAASVALDAPAPGVTSPTPAPAPAGAPHGPAVDKAAAIGEAKTLLAAGLDDATIHASTGVDLNVIAALRNAAA